MTAPAIYGALGAQLSVSTALTSPTYSEIYNVTDIGDFGTTWDEADTFNLGSTLKTKRLVLRDPSEVEFTVQYDHADSVHGTILYTYAYQIPTATNSYNMLSWQLELADKGTTNGTEYSFQGYIKAFKLNAQDPEGLLTATVTVSIQTAITVTAAA